MTHAIEITTLNGIVQHIINQAKELGTQAESLSAKAHENSSAILSEKAALARAQSNVLGEVYGLLHPYVSLTFADLRRANERRLPQFKDAHGRPAHSEPDGSDWSDAEWLQAVVGELGEYANVRKKLLRGDFTPEQALPMMRDELADVVCYLDILAMRLGIDLGEAVRDKFNRVSERVGSDVKL